MIKNCLLINFITNQVWKLILIMHIFTIYYHMPLIREERQYGMACVELANFAMGVWTMNNLFAEGGGVSDIFSVILLCEFNNI